MMQLGELGAHRARCHTGQPNRGRAAAGAALAGSTRLSESCCLHLLITAASKGCSTTSLLLGFHYCHSRVSPSSQLNYLSVLQTKLLILPLVAMERSKSPLSRKAS